MAWLICGLGILVTIFGFKVDSEYLKGVGNGLSMGVVIIGIAKLIQLMN
ncbi:hypothetical protein A5881_003900 [Enterococcus termitis]|nr:hypothetical protein A5881_003920 [Enterococcus termitis]